MVVVKNFEISVVGSINMDMTCYMNEFPMPGETIFGNRFETGFGGKAANQASMAAKLGARVCMIGRVGDDSNGQSYLDHFRSLGVDVSSVKISEKQTTGVATIWVNGSGQNSIVVVPGANNDVSADDVKHGDEAIASSSVALVGLEVPVDVARVAMETARKNGVKSIWNAAPMPKDLPGDMLALPDVLVINETEASIATSINVTDVKQAKVAIDYLREHKNCKTVIITLGEGGAVYGPTENGIVAHTATSKVKAVDSTGAGDAFLGSLGFFMAKYPRLSLGEAVRRSCEIATITVLKRGTQASYPTASELPEGIIPSDS